MAIQIGDAVMRVVIDMSDLSALEARMNALPSKVRPAGDEIEKLGKSGKIAGGQIAEGAVLARREMTEARGTAALLGEQLGIHLPRHVRNFLTSFQGVGSVLSAAFSATAVFFLIEALIKGTEKMSAWVAETYIFTAAQRAVNAVLLDSNKAISDYNEKLKALQQQFELIGQTGTARTLQEGIFKAEDAHKAQLELNDISNEIYGLRNGLLTVPQAADVANGAIRKLHQNLSEKDIAKFLVPTGAEKDDVIHALESIHAELLSRQKTFDQNLANISQQAVVDQERDTQAADEARIQRALKTGDALTALELQEVLHRNASLKVSYMEDAVAKKQADEEKYQHSLTALRDERALNNQREQDEINRLQTSRILFESDPTKNAATLQGIDEQLLAVQRQYAVKQIEIDGEIVVAERNHQEQREATLREFEQRKRDLIERGQLEIKKILIGAGVLDKPADQSTLPKVPDQIINSYGGLAQQLEALSRAYQTLKIEGSGALALQLADEKKAWDDVKKARDENRASDNDVIAAHTQVIATEAMLAAQQGVSRRAILQKLEVEAKEVEAQIALAEATNKNTDALKAQLAVIHNLSLGLGKDIKGVDNAIAAFEQQAKQKFLSVKTAAAALNIVFQGFAQAAGTALAAWLTYQEGFGAALKKAFQQEMATIASRMLVKGLEWTAQGIFDSFWNPSAAPSDFAAAGTAYAVAALAGGVARSLGNQNAASGTGGTSSQIDQTSPANQPEQQPVQVVNIQHLADGGLVSRRTLALVGDTRRGGGHAREGILPLDDDRAMDAIAGELAERVVDHLRGQGGGDVHNHYNIKGDVIDYNQLMRKQSRMVKTGRARLNASDSFRTTKRG